MNSQPRKLRMGRQARGKSWFDYFERIAVPIVFMVAGLYAMIFIDAPLWALLATLALVVIVFVAVYASWDLDRQEAERVQRYGARGTACEICGAAVEMLAYEDHMWHIHPSEARALKSLTRSIIWWTIGIACGEALFVTATVGWSVASLVAFLVAGILIAFLAAIGITLQVLWPRRLARARRVWLKTHVSPLPLEMEQR